MLAYMTRAFLFLFVMFAASITVTGQNYTICDDSIYARYDESNNSFTIHVHGDKDWIFIKIIDIEAIGEIKLDNEDNEWCPPIFGNTNYKVSYTSINNDAKYLKYYETKDSGQPCYMEIKNVTKLGNLSETSEKQDVVVNSDSVLKWLYVAIGVLVVIVLILVIALVVIKRRKKVHIEFNNATNNVIAAIEEMSVDTKKGLQHVYQNKDNYYAVSMNELFDDTAIKTVYFSRSIVGELNTFFKDFLGNSERTNETGCYLLGCWDYSGNNNQYDISIEYMVQPGKDAVFNEHTLSFGREIGISLGTMIDGLVEKTKKDYVRTSWMHSHPGLGLFLSSHDLIVQKQLAYSDAPNRLLAIVIDTNTPDWSMAMFAPKKNGSMNNKQELKKTISFDTLYLWSRKKLANQSANSEHFTLRVNLPGFSTLNFSGKAINQMDDAVYSNKNGVSGYFYGTKRGSDIYIDKCLQYNNIDAIGCFMNDPRPSCDSIPTGLINVDGCDFVMVCCDGVKMSLFVKKDAYYQRCSHCDSTFMDYKEWTRRKRI